MSKILVKYDTCYADEFNCEGFAIFDKIKWESYCKKVKDFFETKKNAEIEVYFGTNEANVFYSYDDWYRGIDETDITDAEADILIKLFGNGDKNFTFGTGSNVLDILDYVSRYKDEDDEDDN